MVEALRLFGFSWSSLSNASRASDICARLSIPVIPALLVKLWMQISPDEQLRRFHSRRDDPLKSWKLTKDDWHNRDKREDYGAAVRVSISVDRNRRKS